MIDNDGVGHIDDTEMSLEIHSTRRYCVMKGRALGRVRLDGHVAGPRKCCKKDDADW